MKGNKNSLSYKGRSHLHRIAAARGGDVTGSGIAGWRRSKRATSLHDQRQANIP
jgi:hypothetical protein